MPETKPTLLRWSFIFLLFAIAFAILGFTDMVKPLGIEPIAQALFFVCAVLFVLALLAETFKNPNQWPE